MNKQRSSLPLIQALGRLRQEEPEFCRTARTTKRGPVTKTNRWTNKQETKDTINTKAKCLKCVSTALGTYDKSNKGWLLSQGYHSKNIYLVTKAQLLEHFTSQTWGTEFKPQHLSKEAKHCTEHTCNLSAREVQTRWPLGLRASRPRLLGKFEAGEVKLSGSWGTALRAVFWPLHVCAYTYTWAPTYIGIGTHTELLSIWIIAQSLGLYTKFMPYSKFDYCGGLN